MQPDRQALSDRMARRFAELPDERIADLRLAVIICGSAAAVVGLVAGYAIVEWFTALNAARIEVGL